MRRALELALEQGKGRDAAVIYANLSTDLFQYDGPQAALDTCLEGIEFSERRGIAGFTASLAAASTWLPPRSRSCGRGAGAGA